MRRAPSRLAAGRRNPAVRTRPLSGPTTSGTGSRRPLSELDARPGGAPLQGRWVRLTGADAHSAPTIADLLLRLAVSPEMATPRLFSGLPRGSRFAATAVITGVQTGRALGLVTNVEADHYPGVAGLTIYVDRRGAAVACAMEAWGLYVGRLFAAGVHKVQMDVLSFNTTVHRLMAKIGARADATFRQHFFIAGRYWDVVSYSLTRDGWDQVGASYRRLYRGRAPWDDPTDR